MEPHFFAMLQPGVYVKDWGTPDCGGNCPEEVIGTHTFDCGAQAEVRGVFTEQHISGHSSMNMPFSTSFWGAGRNGNYGWFFAPSNGNGECLEAAALYADLTGFQISGLTGSYFYYCQGTSGVGYNSRSHAFSTGHWSAWFNLQSGVARAFPHGTLCYGLEPDTEPTPTATPTPAASFCDSIEGEGDDGGNGGMELPRIIVGPSQCLTLGGQEIDVSVLNLVPGLDGLSILQIPGFEICARAISFGTLNLFGMEFDVDIFATLLALAGLLRLVLRS